MDVVVSKPTLPVTIVLITQAVTTAAAFAVLVWHATTQTPKQRSGTAALPPVN